MKNVLNPLAESLLIPLGSTAETLATDAVIQKKSFGSDMITLIIMNEEMGDIMNIVYIKEFDFLIKGVGDTIKDEANE